MAICCSDFLSTNGLVILELVTIWGIVSDGTTIDGSTKLGLWDLKSLLGWYCHIPFYFHLYIISSSSLIHCHITCQSNLLCNMWEHLCILSLCYCCWFTGFLLAPFRLPMFRFLSLFSTTFDQQVGLVYPSQPQFSQVSKDFGFSPLFLHLHLALFACTVSAESPSFEHSELIMWCCASMKMFIRSSGFILLLLALVVPNATLAHSTAVIV